MPSLNDIANVAEALEKSPVAVVQDRCVGVRNRNATCRRCAQACSPGAIEVSGNRVHVSASVCVGCGACAVVCPTEALVFLEPADAMLASAIDAALAACGSEPESPDVGEVVPLGNRAVFACARIASKKLADPALYAEVPCLARVGEPLMLALFARGIGEVLLVDGDCATCKYRDCARLADVAVEQANALVAAHGGGARARRETGFPDDMLAGDVEGLFGTTRRGFFSDAVGAARDTALTAAKTTMAQELGLNQSEPEIGERLRVNEQGTLPLIGTPLHDVAINALYEIGEPTVDAIQSRLFGSVDIDVSKCNACGMCAMFCPTGALRRDEAPKANAPLRYLEFSASACVQCGLCADVCWKQALTLTESVDASQLYDFEPVTFDLATAQRQSKSLFGK